MRSISNDLWPWNRPTFSSQLPAAAAKSPQSCPTLCDPIDGSPPGSPVPGILQARTLEWVAISFSNAWKWKVKVKLLSRVWLLVTPWTAAHQAPPSMGFSRREYWSRVPLPSPSQLPVTCKRLARLLGKLQPQQCIPTYKEIFPTKEGNLHLSLSKELGRWIFKKKGNTGCLQSQREIHSFWVIYWPAFIKAYQWGYLESPTLHQCWELCINLFHTQWK